MAHYRLFRRIDLQIAIVLLLAASAVCAFTYRRIVQEEMPDQAILSSFPGGDHRYALMGEQGCIGEMQTSMRFDEDQYQFKLNGNFRFLLWGKPMDSTIDGFASFNSIGQLGGAAFTVRADKLFVRFGAIDLNPITLKLRVVYDGRPAEYQLQVPGPASLKENRDRTYRLEYLHFGKVMSNYSQMIEHPALKSLRVKSIEVGENHPGCADNRAALDASLLASFVTLVLQR